MNIFLKIATFVLILGLSFYILKSLDPTILVMQSTLSKFTLLTLSGVFYASFLTAPLSVVLFIILGSTTNIYLVTILGGLGAALGDLLILKFFRSLFKTFSFIKHAQSFRKIKKISIKYHLNLVGIILGMLLVASPFPDELGLILLGISSLSYFKLAILTFVLNSLGILAILLIAKSFL
ncbi:hypothetical protein HYW43_03955 [Candidatus Daviesbacteria bacterium]|nr:hypothetical protein [Candidatus Daviesbacteria bacterium]